MAGLRLRGRAHGHPLPWLATWQWLWEWAPGGVSAAYPGANSSSRLLCLAVGQLDRPPDLTDDGYDSQVMCVSGSASRWVGTSPWIPRGDRWAGRPAAGVWQKGPWEQCQEGLQHRGSAVLAPLPPELSFFCPGSGQWAASHTQAHVSMCLLSPGRTNLWLNIGGKEAAALSMFHVSVPLPGVSGGVTGQGSCCSLASA